MFRFEVSYQNDSKIWVDLSDWVRPITDKSTLDETHDESQIFLSCSSIDTPFKPFTHFIINIIEIDDETNTEVDRNTLYRVVIADEIEQVVFDEDRQLYNHDIRLAEATKELERYTVDNLSFTNYWAKAFQTGEAGFYIKNSTIYPEWYNLNFDVYVNEEYPYYPNAFSDYNSNDAYFGGILGTVKPKIEETFVYKILSANNDNINQYTLDSTLPSNVLLNNQILIPNVTFNQISQINLMNEVSNIFWRELVKVNIDKYVQSVKLVSPSGNVIGVTTGTTQQLTEEGVYKLQYYINTDIRFIHDEWGRLTDTVKNVKISDLYTASQTVLEVEVYCLANYNTDISKLSIYDILNKICQVTPTRFKDIDQQKYFISQEARKKYGGVEAPELIITGKNLWEALKIVGGIINAIPYLKISDPYNWNVIDYMPLSSEEKTSNTVEEEYCNTTANYLSDSYTASYDIYAENLINPLSTNEGQINEAGWYVGKTLRSEEAEISETSMDIETVYPIYRVNKLRYIDFENNKDIDLTNWVEEIALYNTELSNSESSGKAVHLCYQQGKRNIYGLHYKISRNSYAAADNKVSIKNVIYYASGQTIPKENINLLNAKFIVEYVPYLNARIRYFKTNAPKLNIDTSMFQNQSSNVIDTIALGRKMVANLGRTSNLGYVDSLKVYHLNEIPVKGQRTADGYFVSDVVVEYDQNHLLASVSYTRDYQKISEYINIQNLQRYFEVSEKQSLDRYVNTHMFYVFGSPIAEINKEFGLNQAHAPNRNYIASLLYDDGTNRKINASLIYSYGYNYQLTSDLTYQADKGYYTKTGDRYDYLVPNVDYEIGDAITQPNTTIYDTTLEKVAQLYLNSNAISSGNQISIITDFQDNYGAGYQAEPYLDNGTQAKMNKAVPYANQYGEIKEMRVRNITDSNITYSPSATLETNMTTFGNSLPATTALDANNQPTGGDYFRIASSYQNDGMPTFSNIGCDQTIQLNKDSREVIHINQQHHFLKNDDSIIIGNAMTEKCRFIQSSAFSTRLVFLKDTIDDYEFKIKDDDIITVQAVGTGIRFEKSTVLADLCNEINSTNIPLILSGLDRNGQYLDFTNTGSGIFAINQQTFINAVDGFAGKYVFSYNGSNWEFAGEVVDLTDYGFTYYTGEIVEGDQIIVTYNNRVFIEPLLIYDGSVCGLTEDAKAWAIITDENDLIIGQNIDLYADDINNDNFIPPIYMSVTSQY